MKTIILLVAILFNCLTNSQAQKKIIGEIIEGQYILTVNPDSLMNAGNKILKKQNVNGTISSVSIELGVIDNTSNEYFYILFTDV